MNADNSAMASINAAITAAQTIYKAEQSWEQSQK